MKLIRIALTMFTMCLFVSAPFGIDPTVLFGLGVASAALLAISGFSTSNLLMADTIDIGEMAAELKKLFKTQPGLPAKWYLSDKVMIREFSQRIAKVKGEYHVPLAWMSSVVQGFKDEWTPFGKLYIKAKTLTDSHLKLNVPIKPHEILGSYLGETLYAEDKALKDRPISKYITDMMNEKVPEDMDILSIDGEYDEALMNTEFGYSMKGLIRVLLDQVSATLVGDAEQPMFIIPGDGTLDQNNPENIINEIRAFERKIPKKFRNRVKEIFVERFWYDEYQDQYRALHGGDTNVKDGDYSMTYGGRKLVPIDSEKMGNLIFATTKKNIIDMIDLNDLPRIHDIQTQDYTVKLFGEGRGGFDFAINQAVFVRSEETSTLGLHNTAQNHMLFNMTEVSGSGSGS